MKMKKINIKNVIKLITLIVCIGIIIHDLFIITIGNFSNSVTASWTMFGFITFILACFMCELLYSDLEEQIKKYPMVSRKTQRIHVNRK